MSVHNWSLREATWNKSNKGMVSIIYKELSYINKKKADDTKEQKLTQVLHQRDYTNDQ